jgi:putative inorganic carbon (hco3(-)) transporter
MDYCLFLILNALLLVRPEELLPELTGYRLYLWTILGCLTLSGPKILQNFSGERLKNQPVLVCVLGFYFSSMMTMITHGETGDQLTDFITEFGKVILYMLLLLAVIDTPERFRQFIGWLIVYISMICGIAFLEFFGEVDFPNIMPCMQGVTDPETGYRTYVPRLVSTGIFNDPNDLCLVLTLGVLSCFYLATSSSMGTFGFVWLLPISLFFYAMTLTQSKGGFLGMMAAVGAWLLGKYGSIRSLVIATACLPIMMALVSGRQGSIGGDSTHERLMMWADGLTEFFRRPMEWPFGIGVYFIKYYTLVAHNSFVQAYVEEGLVGGGFFAGAFFFAVRIAYLTRQQIQNDWVKKTAPFVFAVAVGYAAGCYSVTRNYVIPTYLVLGLVTAYSNMVMPVMPHSFQVNATWWKRLAFCSVAGIVFLKFFTQFAGQAGL